MKNLEIGVNAVYRRDTVNVIYSVQFLAANR